MTVLPVFLNALAEHQAILESPIDTDPAPLLPVPNPTKSFWIDTPNANPLAKEGSEGPLTHDADICIIGSGITGISAAYHISRLLAAAPPTTSHSERNTPVKITVLEARDFCSGATGRNGGHLTPTAFHNFVEYAALYGTDDAVRAIALEQHTASDIVKFLKDTGNASAVDLVEGGHVDLFFTEAEVVAARADYAAAKAAGVNVDDVRFLTKETVQKEYGAMYSGVDIPGHNLWPLKLVTHLYRAAMHISASSSSSSSNLTLHTRTPVTAIAAISPSLPDGPTAPEAELERSSARRWNLTTPRGPIACSYVLHATNGYASHLLPQLRGPAGIIPTRGQIIATRASAPLERVTRASWSGNEGFEYWFPRPLDPQSDPGAENEGNANATSPRPLVILGGGRESTKPAFELYTVDDATVHPRVGETLRAFLPAVFPGMYDERHEPEMEWTGIMGHTKTSDPFVGPVLDPTNPDSNVFEGQYISAGYTGHGMPRAYGCAEAVSQMIVGDIMGKEWTIPDWLPKHHLTQNRLND
ncbi:FAD dependent oxidoreductase [Daedaleopsis nitida]|nr:FAD dependent oxidoreductase [Daedaleopsis nitida]